MITHRIVSQHHGEIHAESPGEDRGATFTVRLPVRQAEDDPAALGAEVDGDDVAGGHQVGSTGTRWTGTPTSFQARTSSSGTPSSHSRPVIPAVSTNGCRANRPTLLLSNSP